MNVRFCGAAVAVILLSATVSASPARAADAPLTVIRLGLLSSDNSANVWDAEELGYFKAAGLDVQAQVFGGGPVAAQAVASGALDMGTGNVATVLGYFATDDWLDQHAEVVAKFIAALKRASEWANTHKRESGFILAKYTKMDQAVINAMSRSTYGTGLDPALLQPVIDGAVKYGVIDKTIDATELIWKR